MMFLTKNWINSSTNLEQKFSHLFLAALRSFIIIVINFYKAHLSPLLVGRCIYYPSCSSYALDALKKAPLHKALYAIVLRIFRCHPFAHGGWDPFIPQSELKHGDICCD